MKGRHAFESGRAFPVAPQCRQPGAQNQREKALVADGEFLAHRHRLEQPLAYSGGVPLGERGHDQIVQAGPDQAQVALLSGLCECGLVPRLRPRPVALEPLEFTQREGRLAELFAPGPQLPRQNRRLFDPHTRTDQVRLFGAGHPRKGQRVGQHLRGADLTGDGGRFLVRLHGLLVQADAGAQAAGLRERFAAQPVAAVGASAAQGFLRHAVPERQQRTIEPVPEKPRYEPQVPFTAAGNAIAPRVRREQVLQVEVEPHHQAALMWAE